MTSGWELDAHPVHHRDSCMDWVAELAQEGLEAVLKSISAELSQLDLSFYVIQHHSADPQTILAPVTQSSQPLPQQNPHRVPLPASRKGN